MRFSFESFNFRQCHGVLLELSCFQARRLPHKLSTLNILSFFPSGALPSRSLTARPWKAMVASDAFPTEIVQTSGGLKSISTKGNRPNHWGNWVSIHHIDPDIIISWSKVVFGRFLFPKKNTHPRDPCHIREWWWRGVWMCPSHHRNA